MKNIISKILQFFKEDIWRIQNNQLSKSRVIFINTIRVIYLAIKGFIQDKCPQKASALTFYSLLSVVPVVALIFGIAKGFGLAEVLEQELEHRLVGHEEVLSYIITMAKGYINNTKGGLIIGIGLILLFWSVMRVLSKIEQSFNDIWEVKKARSFARKFTDYIALMVVAMLFLISSSSMVMFVASKFSDYALLSIMGRVLAMLLPYVLICVVFVCLILIMPNTKVNLLSAVIGGIVAGVFFQVLQYYYIHFQVGMSKYNAIYCSFAALPLFLIWLQSSWLIVLFGAELAFAIQNVNSFEFEADTKHVSDDYRRIVALFISQSIIKQFSKGLPPLTPMQLSIQLKLPIRLINGILFDLVKSKVLIEVFDDNDEESSYQPALDINVLTASKVLNMIESTGSTNLHYENSEDLSKVRYIVKEFKKLREGSESNILLKDL